MQPGKVLKPSGAGFLEHQQVRISLANELADFRGIAKLRIHIDKRDPQFQRAGGWCLLSLQIKWENLKQVDQREHQKQRGRFMMPGRQQKKHR